jgi:hypothetical protein
MARQKEVTVKSQWTMAVQSAIEMSVDYRQGYLHLNIEHRWKLEAAKKFANQIAENIITLKYNLKSVLNIPVIFTLSMYLESQDVMDMDESIDGLNSSEELKSTKLSINPSLNITINASDLTYVPPITHPSSALMHLPTYSYSIPHADQITPISIYR